MLSTCARVKSNASSLIFASSRFAELPDDPDELIQVRQGDEIAFESSARSSALRSSNCVRRMTTSRRCSM